MKACRIQRTFLAKPKKQRYQVNCIKERGEMNDLLGRGGGGVVEELNRTL